MASTYINIPSCISSSPTPPSPTPEVATTPTIANISALVANTEYAYTFPNDTKQFVIRVRSLDAKLQYSWNSGQSGTQFMTVNYGVSEGRELLLLSGKTIYFQTNKNNKIIEIESWL